MLLLPTGAVIRLRPRILSAAFHKSLVGFSGHNPIVSHLVKCSSSANHFCLVRQWVSAERVRSFNFIGTEIYTNLCKERFNFST